MLIFPIYISNHFLFYFVFTYLFFCRRFQPPQLEERFFHFSSEAIAKIKLGANQEIGNANNNFKLSSFQALIALLWRSIIRAKGLKPGQTTNCKLAANNRTRLDPQLPEEYFGNALGVLVSTTTVSKLLEQSIGKTALLLHQAVVNYTNKDVHGFMHSWLKSPFVFRMDNMLDIDTNSTVQVGSSPRFNIYGNDFVGIGKPIAVRSGFANKFDGKVIVYPGYEGGGSVDAEICLSFACMKALECDEEFMAAVG
ncbi:BAHD acyltransferase DCR [Bienertia sinuspersici]